MVTHPVCAISFFPTDHRQGVGDSIRDNRLPRVWVTNVRVCSTVLTFTFHSD